MRGEPRSKLDQHRRHEVCHHERESLLRDRIERAGTRLDALGEAVALGVRARRIHGKGIDVDRDDVLGAEPQRGHRQDPRPAADVEPALRHRLQLLEQLEAAARRGMQPGAERHARIEHDAHLVVARLDDVPRRHDEDATDALRDVVLPPGIGPVGVVDLAHSEPADRPKAECLQVPERPLRLVDKAATVARGRDVRRHDERGGRIGASGELVVGIVNEACGLDRRAVRMPAEDLGDGLDGLHIGLDAQLQPAHRRAR